jgi:hypothetical protein
VYVNRKPFGAESNVMYRNELNRPATGVHTGGRAGEAARKEITRQTHGLDKYGRTQAYVLLPGGTNANHTLVTDGWCWGYRTYAPRNTVPSLGPVPDRMRWAGKGGVEVLRVNVMRATAQELAGGDHDTKRFAPTEPQ